MPINQRIEEIFPQVVQWRRYLHQHPEPSYHEEQTAKMVAEHLISLGLEVKTGIGGHGVTGLLRGEKSGPTIALRADMDALPIQDEKDCSYRSTVPGVMHACGHDGHTAILLGVATLLQRMKLHLRGNILFLFQPAEELPPGGAKQMIAEGVLTSVDAIYGLHLWSPMPVGKVGYFPQEAMAAGDGFEIEIIGKGGHGGLPHQTIDAVMIASHLVVNLQSIISRQLDPLRSGVITVGEIKGGSAFNVIAERCKVTGTTRSFDSETRQYLLDSVEKVTKSTCSMFGASSHVTIHQGYPALVNHPSHSEQVKQSAQKVVGHENVVEMERIMGSEDFAYYLEKVPGSFFFVGAGNREKKITAPHHHPSFDIDESAMKIGIHCFINLILQHLTNVYQKPESADPENVSLKDWIS